MPIVVLDNAGEEKINGEAEMDRRASSSSIGSDDRLVGGGLGGNVGVSDQKTSREETATARIESESGELL